MIITLVFLVMIIGLLMYVLAVNPKVQEIGRIMFFCGLFVICLSYDKFVGLVTR